MTADQCWSYNEKVKQPWPDDSNVDC